MRQEDIDERLVDWELARQRGEDIDPNQLLAEAGPWQHYLQERLEVLRKTSWMLDDPAPGPAEAWVSELVSKAEVTVKNSVVQNDTPSNELSPGRGSDGVGLDQSLLDDSPVQATRVSLPHHMPEVPGFRYESLLGKGGFGVVFRAVDETLSRPVAIKFPLIGGKRERQKYIAEARNASRVDVVGIVPIYHVGESKDGTPYVIQKLIDGKSLREILKFGGCLSASQAAELFTRICQAAAAAHAQALVHRDLKPENILVDNQGLPWITDFGLAVAEDDPNLSAASVAGTPNFMSPEQILGRVDWLDGRCDIWALGVMLYQCLTGRLPFHSPNTMDLHDKILNLEPRPIAQRQPSLVGDWDKIFRKCCAKSISERYRNALEMADDLKRLGQLLDPDKEKHNAVLQQLQAGDPSRRGQLSSSRNWAGWPVRRLTPIGALAVGALTLALFALGFSLFRSGLPTDELVVSLDGRGTHRSIQAALEAANENTSISIEPGVYRESLVVAGKATLRGRGGQSQKVEIVGDAGPAFKVDIGGQLAVYGMSIAVDDSTQGIWNAIEVRGGSVLLDDCSVSANEYDCVHLQAESSLIATNCKFYNYKHPAIFARLAKDLVVRDSSFYVGSDQFIDNTKYLAGIQVFGSGGSISDCTFSGKSAVGIEWTDAEDTVTFDDCKFQNLERAVIATACGDFQIGGHGRALFDNCQTAIELTGCGGEVKNCQIDDQGRMDGRGLVIRGLSKPDVPIKLQSCQISGAQAPIVLSQTRVTATSLVIDGSADMGIRLLDNSFLELSSSQIRNCETVGLLLESSHAELQRCTIAANKAAGVVVDGLDDAFQATSCLIDDNDVGIIVLSGAARLVHTNIKRATTGVLLARRHKLTFAATCDSQLSLDASGGSIEASQHGIQFLSPGSYRLDDCSTSDPQNQPVLDGQLERVDGTEFVTIRQRGNAEGI